MTYRSVPAYYMCDECGFTSRDENLVRAHSCDVVAHGGFCEDYPACGHEMGDCNGLLYGSDEAIKEHAMKHSMCDHENGLYECDDDDDEGDED